MLAVRHPVVALVGNPNTGKTTLFNALAGMHQRVGNYPGVTVETKKGRLRHGGQTLDLVDLPGTYSLAPRSPDEMVAVDLILGHTAEGKPDVVVTIVDASNLERNLYLTTQVLELGVPVVVALNMMDVAKGQGLVIDTAQLEQNLGVPVVPLQANKSKGLEELKDAIGRALALGIAARGPAFPEAFEKEVGQLQGRLSEVETFLVRRLLLDVGGYTEDVLTKRHGVELLEEVKQARQRLGAIGLAVPGIEARTRYAWIRTATVPCVQRPKVRVASWTDRLDRVLTHRVWGTLIFLGVMFLVFQSIFLWAQPVMGLVTDGFTALGELVKGALAPSSLRDLLVDGVIKGVGGVLVFLPQILILFAFIAFLEDCGYMARAAFLMDRLMARCGLNGKSFIPLLSSMACAVPGIMAARVIENRRDRFATIVVAPLMSCSARLPVYLLLAGTFLGPVAGYPIWAPGLAIFAMYLLGLVVAPLVAFCLKRTLLRGETPAFVMEMPLYKRPSLRLVARRSIEAGWMFVRRAGTIILASMIVIWALLYFPIHGVHEGASVSFVEAKTTLEERLEEQRDDLEHEADEDKKEALEKKIEKMDDDINELEAAWKRQSYLGRVGQAIEPAVRPLGWDWRIGTAALASFPAREVIVGTLGILFSQGEGDAKDEEYRGKLGDRLKGATWDGSDRPLMTVPAAFSLMVFFALCCQCISTLAVIKRETGTWLWPAFTFVYMTALAYVGALIVYQVGSLLV
jgi:ferrous iron transport protein B